MLICFYCVFQRHPVWGAGDYDDENVPKFSRTLPEPSRQQQRRYGILSNKHTCKTLLPSLSC